MEINLPEKNISNIMGMSEEIRLMWLGGDW